MTDDVSRQVFQLRLVVEADDYDEAVALLPRRARAAPCWSPTTAGAVLTSTILDAGRATLELANPAQKKMIDAVEVGRDVAGEYPVAFEVADTAEHTDRLVTGGAELVAPPTPDSVALAERAARGAGRAADHALPGARRRLSGAAITAPR